MYLRADDEANEPFGFANLERERERGCRLVLNFMQRLVLTRKYVLKVKLLLKVVLNA